MTARDYLVDRQKRLNDKRSANETQIASLGRQVRELEQENVFIGFEIVQLKNIIRNMSEKSA